MENQHGGREHLVTKSVMDPVVNYYGKIASREYVTKKWDRKG
jgi:hypothetical protein